MAAEGFPAVPVKLLKPQSRRASDWKVSPWQPLVARERCVIPDHLVSGCLLLVTKRYAVLTENPLSSCSSGYLQNARHQFDCKFSPPSLFDNLKKDMQTRNGD